MSCVSPVISLGDHPEFANDKASPHRWPMRQSHTTEDELVIPWTMVLVGVPLMALKMWREFGKTLVFSSSGQILRHKNTTLPRCHAPRDISQWQCLFIPWWSLLPWMMVLCGGTVSAQLANGLCQIRITQRKSSTTRFVSFTNQWMEPSRLTF